MQIVVDRIETILYHSVTRSKQERKMKEFDAMHYCDICDDPVGTDTHGEFEVFCDECKCVYPHMIERIQTALSEAK